MTNWTRPPWIVFPSIWNTFEGKNCINGFRRKYWIQDLTDEYKNEVLYHMSTGFLAQEKIFKSSRVADDPESVQEFLTVWKKSIEEKISLICLTKDEDGTTRFVGCNLLLVSRQKNPPKLTTKGKCLNMAFSAIFNINTIKDVYSELKVDEYLDAFGLYVLPEYRGESIGTEILKSRRKLSLALGLKVSITMFSTIGGQKCAERAGFKDILVFPYKDLNKLNSSYNFDIENDDKTSIKIMYARYDE